MAGVYTVSQINAYIKHLFTEDFALSSISIKGEVSNCKYHSSGHIYFTLKDGGACLAAVMFAGNRSGLSFTLKEGQKVVASGSVNVYERDGKYQLYAKNIVLDGEGDLYRKFEELKGRLLEMGMFEKEYKKPIPKYAMNIGIVTSGTGAAIQDIINISRRRNPYVKLYLYSATVQGDGAVPSIISGINCLDDMGLDVIIVGRGGGSIEDLWAFNDESVARAIFACKTPVVSAVGHETDTTIADYVADMRAPTPSAAAELTVFDYRKYLEDIDGLRRMLDKLLQGKINAYRSRLENYSLRLENKNPVKKINDKRQQLDNIYDRLYEKIKMKLSSDKSRLAVMAERLNNMSPLTRLDRGFAYVASEGKTLKSISQVKEGDIIEVSLRDGNIKAGVISTENNRNILEQNQI